MNSNKPHFLKNILQGSVLKLVNAKFICLLSLLFLGITTLFSQPAGTPELEWRIVDFRYVSSISATAPTAFTGPALVFDLQVKAANEDYILKKWPLISADIMIEWYIDVSGGPVSFKLPPYNFIAPVPSMGPLGITKYAYGAFPYPLGAFVNGVQIHWDKPSDKPPITGTWLRVGTFIIGINSGVPGPGTWLELYPSRWDSSLEPQFYGGNMLNTWSGWGSGLQQQYGMIVKPCCPSKVYLGGDEYAIFADLPGEFCEGDPDYILPTVSDNGYAGTWDNGGIVQPTFAGLQTFTFTPTNPALCPESFIFIYNPKSIVNVNDLGPICGGAMYHLRDAITLKSGDAIGHYKFYTYDIDADTYNAAAPTNLVKWVAGDYDYYVRYENPDSCLSDLIPFQVHINAPDTAVANVTCDNGEITEIEITSPVGPNFVYSLDGTNYTSDIDFGGPFATALTSPVSIYVMDLDDPDHCVSKVEVSCPPCADPPAITIVNNNGINSGKLCIHGTYTISGTFENGAVLNVTHNGEGGITPKTAFDLVVDEGKFSVTYTPDDLDIGNTVRVTFTIPEEAPCSEKVEYVEFMVYGRPTVGPITSDFTVYTCANQGTNIVLAAPTGFTSYSWDGGTAPLDQRTVTVTYAQVAAAGTTFTVTVTDANGCTNTQSTTITKDITPPAAPNVTAAQGFCRSINHPATNKRVNDLVPNTGVIWYDQTSGGTAYAGTDFLTHGTTYYAAAIGANGCESQARSAVTVTLTDSAYLRPTVPNQVLCDGATVADIKVTDPLHPVLFYDVANHQINTPPKVFHPGDDGNYLARYDYSPGYCQELRTAIFYIIIDFVQSPTPNILPQEFCDGARISNIVVPSGTTIFWYNDDFPGSPALPPNTALTNHTYWATQILPGDCAESDRIAVPITIKPNTPAPGPFAPVTLCAPATLYDLGITMPGYDITFYSTSTSAAIPGYTNIPIGANTYWVAAQETGGTSCISNRAQVNVTVYDCNKLLDCAKLSNKVVNEDAFKACKYTHIGTSWNAENATTVAFDAVNYIVNGKDYPTLDGVEFPLGTSLVEVEATYGTIVNTCYFYVTVELVCPTVSDPDGDGNTYTVSKVAGMCWTTNLQTTTYMNTMTIEFAKPYNSPQFPNEAANLANFGRLYTWYSALGIAEGDENGAPLNCQGICPDGWRLPTTEECTQLNIWSADQLKSMSNAHWLKPGNNESTFDWRGAGKYNTVTGQFEDLKGTGGFWACDVATGKVAPYLKLTYYMNDCEATSSQASKLDGLSVRCIWAGIPCQPTMPY